MDPHFIATMQKVRRRLSDFDISFPTYRSIMFTMSSVMGNSLRGNPASVKMYPSYVSRIPIKEDDGESLVLDIRGNYIRIFLVSLLGRCCPSKIDSVCYRLPDTLFSGKSEELFDFIAGCVAKFIESKGLNERPLKLCFTFAFPCNQKGINEAYLVRWTRNFNIPDAVGRDIAKLLQESLDKKGLDVKCVALINDAVAVLASCALTHGNCEIGVIVDEGTNAAYVEEAENVSVCSKQDQRMVINTEWGAFGEGGELDSILTEFDRQLDEASLYPGKQTFEKLVSGAYLGEIVRLVLVKLIKEELLFGGQLPESLSKPGGFPTKFISLVERDKPGLLFDTRHVLLQLLHVPTVDPLDENIVRLVCESVSKRAAYLAGTGISAIINRQYDCNVTVGVEGSLFMFHPNFRKDMCWLIKEFNSPSEKIVVKVLEDGFSAGASGIVAALTRDVDAS